MGIFDRMGRVISSNINALLDKAEDPKKALELTLAEMREQLRQAKGEVVDGIAAEKVLHKKVDELDAEVEKWERRAELALKSEDESLAREALKQKSRLVGERDRAEALRAEQRGAVLNMKREMERMEAKCKELEARKSTIAQEMAQARKGGGPEALGTSSGPGGGAFAEFRRMEAAIEGKVAEAAAGREVEEALHEGLSEAELEAKFRSLEGGAGTGRAGAAAGEGGDPALDQEIARLKKKLRIGEG
ncbi:MAG: PspA/IM30 family protein [Deltaproteobacteria bacterium]|nr:PspA/IM30 family protein [Deltaproteobacteria bacterium]